MDAMACIPVGPIGIPATIRTLATTIGLSVVTIRALAPVIPLIAVIARALMSILQSSTTSNGRMATIVDMPAICVWTIPAMVGISKVHVPPIPTIIKMPAVHVPTVAMTVETRAVITNTAMTPAMCIMAALAAVHWCMMPLVGIPIVMPLIPAVPLGVATVARAGHMPVIARHLQQGSMVNRLTVLTITGLHVADSHKAGKTEYRSRNCCDECSHDYVLCVIAMVTNEVTGKRLHPCAADSARSPVVPAVAAMLVVVAIVAPMTSMTPVISMMPVPLVVMTTVTGRGR